jgi:hypothetical protein
VLLKIKSWTHKHDWRKGEVCTLRRKKGSFLVGNVAKNFQNQKWTTPPRNPPSPLALSFFVRLFFGPLMSNRRAQSRKSAESASSSVSVRGNGDLRVDDLELVDVDAAFLDQDYVKNTEVLRERFEHRHVRAFIDLLVHHALAAITCDYRVQGGKAILALLGPATIGRLMRMIRNPLQRSYLLSTSWDVLVFARDNDKLEDLIKPLVAAIETVLAYPMTQAALRDMGDSVSAFGLDARKVFVSLGRMGRLHISLGQVELLTFNKDSAMSPAGRSIGLAQKRDGIYFADRPGVRFAGLIDLLDKMSRSLTSATFDKKEKTAFRLKLLLAAHDTKLLNPFYNLRVWTLDQAAKNKQKADEEQAASKMRVVLAGMPDVAAECIELRSIDKVSRKAGGAQCRANIFEFVLTGHNSASAAASHASEEEEEEEEEEGA